MMLVYLRMFAALGAVIGLIYLAASFMRKRQGKPGLLNMMAYQSFGPKRGIALMRLGGDILLLGVTPTELKLMKVYSWRELGLPDTEPAPGAGPHSGGKDGPAR
ncbi:MAG: flagellar biosynthetic protein FliO [Nitrospiraceae bacterium]|nr:flagellar biosynthetic protein FliO [Nitrospiraceae bacterium]